MKAQRVATFFVLLAALCCASCCQPIVKTETVTVRVPVVVAVPPVLTERVATPVFAGGTNGDLANYVLALRHALDAANRKLKRIAGLVPEEK